MAETTIGWTATRGPDGKLYPGFTFNPWIGCVEDEDEPGEMSPECAECYAREGQNHRVSKAKGLPLWGAQAHRQVTSVSYWKHLLRWNAQARELGVRLKVFCASLCDLFEDFDGPLAGDPRCWSDLDDVREALWPLIEQCDWLDFLLLTKRPQNVPRMVPAAWLARRRDQHGDPEPCRNCPAKLGQPCHPGCSGPWPRNVWLGATAGTKKGAARRVPELLKIPAPVRFVSYEPALEAVDFRPWLPQRCVTCSDWLRPRCIHRESIDWLIAGGESGPKARPFEVAWMRRVIKQCRDAGVPVYAKQLGANTHDRNDAGFNGQPEDAWDLDVLAGDVEDNPNGYREEYQGAPVRIRLRDKKGEDMAQWPTDLRVREWPEARR